MTRGGFERRERELRHTWPGLERTSTTPAAARKKKKEGEGQRRDVMWDVQKGESFCTEQGEKRPTLRSLKRVDTPRKGWRREKPRWVEAIQEAALPDPEVLFLRYARARKERRTGSQEKNRRTFTGGEDGPRMEEGRLGVTERGVKRRKVKLSGAKSVEAEDSRRRSREGPEGKNLGGGGEGTEWTRNYPTTLTRLGGGKGIDSRSKGCLTDRRDGIEMGEKKGSQARGGGIRRN